MTPARLRRCLSMTTRGDIVASVAPLAFRRPIHPLHAILLAFPFPLFLGCLLANWAYSASYQVQWKNFAEWLNAAGMAVASLVLLWALVDLVRGAGNRGRLILYVVLLGAMWVLGLITAFVHSKDAWGSMPAGLILAAIVALLALAASWVGYSGLGERRPS